LVSPLSWLLLRFFFFNHPPPTHIYTLSLHDALPIFDFDTVCQAEPALDLGHFLGYLRLKTPVGAADRFTDLFLERYVDAAGLGRSEEHTSELQSRSDLVCRLLLEKKKRTKQYETYYG